ncbi:DNA polymerase [Methanolobus bombayensis]|uniref:DNA polymerase n=1 Tax=Methanolobus bombayensis TaxID=38023 RepID=UPI001AE2D158|nr:DNA polymerase [Methanolobus bombayensis]
MSDKLALRVYTQKAGKKKTTPSTFKEDLILHHRRVLVFDTETTTDQYQNMKIGFFQIYQDGGIQHEGLFYDPSMLDEEETEVFKEYSLKNDISLYTLEEFVDDVFYPEVLGFKALCVGFNLPFDISRIAKKVGDSRGYNKGGFTFTLSDKEENPQIVIKKLGSAYSFKLNGTKENQGKNRHNGYFIDAQTLAEVLLQKKHISLEKACKFLKTKTQKIEGVEHGKVTDEYIDYLITDVRATWEVYEKLIDELRIYQINIPPTKIYSNASVGKYALKQLGVKPFLELNPDFSPVLLGNIMSSYYGGRCECKIRKVPTKVTVLDFTSMYPTVTMLLDLWKFIIAESIETKDVTEKIKELLSNINLEFFQNKDNWKDFVVMVKLHPDEDILPVRKNYKGDGSAYNVGVNNLTSDFELWYALPDVISSVLLTGKVPEIVEAVKFIPVGIQEGLKETEILGIKINPRKENLVQVLVEERQKIKQELETLNKEHPDYQHLKSRAQAIKILVNSMSYGIFIELNPEDKKSTIEVHGLDSFETTDNKYEKEGKYFHPLLASMITSGSRLFLAMAEAKVKELGSVHAYMDTDSIFVIPEHAQEVVDYFNKLNPYNPELDIPLLKKEDGKEDVWFYGISSKRYVLYRIIDGKFELVDYKLHGLGHLTNPFSNKDDWQQEIWLDILMVRYGIVKPEDIELKYSTMYAISRLTVSTPNVLHRFDKLNEGKEWKEMIKPFNFFLVGFQTKEENNKAVKPLAPFTKDYQRIVYEYFIDYETGERKKGVHYFKPLSRTISQYAEHPEHKFEGGIGVLERKHVHAKDTIEIGKEANSIDEQSLGVKKAQEFRNKEKIMQKILNISVSEAKELGVPKTTLWDMQKRIRETGKLNLGTPAVRKMI